MVEIHKSQAGSSVIQFNGRFLSSTLDPVAEAQNWINGLHLSGRRKANIILLGLGGGYQVIELMKRHTHAPIIVIEQEKEIIAAAQGLHPQLKESKCRILSWEEFCDDASICSSVLKEPYRVSLVASSFTFHREFYQAIQRVLCGRRAEDLAALHRLREPESALSVALHLINDGKSMEFPTPREILAIEQHLPLSAKQRVALRVLGEMIA